MVGASSLCGVVGVARILRLFLQAIIDFVQFAKVLAGILYTGALAKDKHAGIGN